jgi:hypothetical protein
VTFLRVDVHKVASSHSRPNRRDAEQEMGRYVVEAGEEIPLNAS